MRYTTTAARHGFGLHTFCEWPAWLDGSPLPDAPKEVFDDILFKKKRISGKDYFFKRYTESPFVNIQDYGVLPHNKPEVNSKNVKIMIAYYPQGYAAGIGIPIGDYSFSETVTLDGKPFHLAGVNGTAFAACNSKFIFPEGATGIMVARAASNHQETIIRDLMVQAQGNKSVDWCSGINSTGRIRIERCTAKNFSHNGFDLYGNMERTATDVSGSYLLGCHALENGHDGFFTGRMDGNCVMFESCDARDNGRYGFNDDSFLGSNFISCMAHYNKEGDFFIRDWENGRSLFLGSYSEGGNALSRFGDKTTVLGGTWGTGYSMMNKPESRGSYMP